MKNLIYIIVLLLPFISNGQKSKTYRPYFPVPVHYLDGGLVAAKSVKDSSTVVCCFSNTVDDVMTIYIKNNHKNSVVFYEDIKINDGDDVSIYSANEILEKIYRRFKSNQAWGNIAAAVSANSTQQRSMTRANYNITNGYSNVSVTGTSTTVANDPSAAIEKMKMHNQNARNQASQFSEKVEEIANSLMYLPDDKKEIQGDIVIKGKLKDEFTITVALGGDLHEIKFRKVRN